jgi:DNA end-binding protein Ku
MGELLAMSVLAHAPQVKLPAAFEDELVETKSTDKELELTRQLIQAMKTKQLDITKYRDTYAERLSLLIQSKIEGEDLVTPPAVAEPQVINLMEALKASVERAGGAPRSAPAKPARKMATGESKKKAAAPRKKAQGKKKKSS